MSRRTYLSTVLSTPMPDHWGYSRSMFLECAADGVSGELLRPLVKHSLRAILRVIQSLFLQLIKNYRIVREEDSVSLKSSLMIGLVLVIMFLLISGWNSMIEPIFLHG